MPGIKGSILLIKNYGIIRNYMGEYLTAIVRLMALLGIEFPQTQ
jgi:hypothetical protein